MAINPLPPGADADCQRVAALFLDISERYSPAETAAIVAVAVTAACDDRAWDDESKDYTPSVAEQYLSKLTTALRIVTVAQTEIERRERAQGGAATNKDVAALITTSLGLDDSPTPTGWLIPADADPYALAAAIDRGYVTTSGDGPAKVTVHGAALVGEELPAGGLDNPEDPTFGRCPDTGRCHHGCQPTECWRVDNAGPLPRVFPRDEWPHRIVQVFTKR